MIQLYTTIIYQPILNLLVWVYNLLPGHDIGIAIILLTLFIRLILAPFMHKSLKSQRSMTALQPKIAELREKHKEDQQEQAKQMMALYKEHNVSPFSSCLPLIIQLPILIALYQVFAKALKGNLTGLYHFVSNPGTIDPNFLGFINLSQPNIVFAILAGIAQFGQSWMISKWQSKTGSDNTMKALNIQMLYILPLVSIFIAWRLPAGLPLYWIVTTLFAIGQQMYINRTHKVEVK
jgi:YidC/Oxa1 family membrane protein insertase